MWIFDVTDDIKMPKKYVVCDIKKLVQVCIPQEVKVGEWRVAATPDTVSALVSAGHQVLIERGAGLASGYPDRSYREAGATLSTQAEVYQADLIVKVKEPQTEELALLHPGQTLFCFLHFAGNPGLEEALQQRGVRCIPYETVTDERGALPILAPMSEIAGRIAIQEGAHYLAAPYGGKGLLIHQTNVLILGAGVVGEAAAQLASQLGACVTILDHSQEQLEKVQATCKTRLSDPHAIEEELPRADLLIGALLLPGKSAPKLITSEMVATMEAGSVIIDVAIDQGGCCETSRPTTHAEPTYLHQGIVHYCVTNMPGAFPRTATAALTKAALPYLLAVV